MTASVSRLFTDLVSTRGTFPRHIDGFDGAKGCKGRADNVLTQFKVEATDVDPTADEATQVSCVAIIPPSLTQPSHTFT